MAALGGTARKDGCKVRTDTTASSIVRNTITPPLPLREPTRRICLCPVTLKRARAESSHAHANLTSKLGAIPWLTTGLRVPPFLPKATGRLAVAAAGVYLRSMVKAPAQLLQGVPSGLVNRW